MQSLTSKAKIYLMTLLDARNLIDDYTDYDIWAELNAELKASITALKNLGILGDTDIKDMLDSYYLPE